MLMNKFLARGREFAKISLDVEDPHTNTTGLLSGEWLHSLGVGHEGMNWRPSNLEGHPEDFHRSNQSMPLDSGHQHNAAI